MKRVRADFSGLVEDIVLYTQDIVYNFEKNDDYLPIEEIVLDSAKKGSIIGQLTSDLYSVIGLEIRMSIGNNHARGELSSDAASFIENHFEDFMFAMDPIVTRDSHVPRVKFDIVYFSIPGDILSRPSLYQKGYPEGALDIISLLNDGYKARHVVYDPDADNGVYSLIRRSGARFFERAVDDFKGNYAYDYGVVDIIYSKMI